MTWATGLMAYAILWWLVFFMVLPFGVRTAEEAGEQPGAGHATSAPVRPRLLLKVLVTTVVSAALFAAGYLVAVSGIFDLRGYFQNAI